MKKVKLFSSYVDPDNIIKKVNRRLMSFATELGTQSPDYQKLASLLQAQYPDTNRFVFKKVGEVNVPVLQLSRSKKAIANYDMRELEDIAKQRTAKQIIDSIVKKAQKAHPHLSREEAIKEVKQSYSKSALIQKMISDALEVMYSANPNHIVVRTFKEHKQKSYEDIDDLLRIANEFRYNIK